MLRLVTKWFQLIGSEMKLFLTLSSKNEFSPKIYFQDQIYFIKVRCPKPGNLLKLSVYNMHLDSFFIICLGYVRIKVSNTKK